MPKAASPVRLQKELMDAATQAGERLHRSAAEQIEYWAELGRQIARFVDPNTLIEISAGIARLKVEQATTQPIDPDAIFATLEARRQTGELSQSVTMTYPRYQASNTYPGYLEQLDAEGKRTVGTFKNGIFIAMDEKRA